MDKDIPPNAVVSGRKPPILPKPKIIPEKPRFINVPVSPLVDLSLERTQSPDKFSDDECSIRQDELTNQSPVCSSNHSSQNILDVSSSTACDISSYVKDAITVSAVVKSNEKSFCRQGNHFCKPKPVDDICEIATSGGENGEHSDSDGHSLTSFKSLDLNGPDDQANTSFENSSVSFNTSIEPYDGAPSDATRTGSKGNRAFLIAKEFVTTEQTYVQALRLLVVDFKKHLEDNDCTSGEYDKVVSTLPQLLEFHKGLLIELEQRVRDWTDRPQIADVIVKTFPFLKLYTSYMKDFEAQQNALEDCCSRNPRFYQALFSFENSEVCRKLTLKHYMLKPVQRIPQYRLLLERYLSHLDNGSGDSEWENAKAALTIVQDVLIHANKTIKQSDNLSKLLKLQSKLGNYEIIKPGRSFIKEGQLQKLSRKEIQQRYCILLSDCLLYTLQSSYLRIKYELPLAGMRVFSAKDRTEFEVRTSARSFTLKAKDEDECTEWMTALKKAISENNQRQLTFTNRFLEVSTSNDSFESGKEAPVWVQDQKASMCQICAAKFTVKFRRHHCRCCGRVVCGECSNNRAPLQYQKFQAKRVCDECYDYLKNEFEDPNSNMIDRIRDELGLSESNITPTFEALRISFKQLDASKRIRMKVPQHKNVTGGQMSGHLDSKEKRGWKRFWFVLKDRVLYYYKAEQDVKAYKTLPVLGYKVDQPSESIDEMDKRALFRLTHDNQNPLIFLAPSEEIASRWISALNEATILV
uniref:FYVE, RhoGEF and PH domain-containing protein 6 n=2 Tax=Lygus hesperus TaxID=30085 RepID=A0A0A9Y4P8_LYGHE